MLDFEGKDKNDPVLNQAVTSEVLLSIEDDMHLKLTADLKKVMRTQGANAKILESGNNKLVDIMYCCLLYTSPSPRDLSTSRMPSSA